MPGKSVHMNGVMKPSSMYALQKSCTLRADCLEIQFRLTDFRKQSPMRIHIPAIQRRSTRT